jgi:hypothetical protein
VNILGDYENMLAFIYSILAAAEYFKVTSDNLLTNVEGDFLHDIIDLSNK